MRRFPPIYRFLLADDLPLWQRQLRMHLLVTEFPNCDIVEVQTLAELLRIEKEGLFDVAVVKLQFPDGYTMDWFDQLSQRKSELRVIVQARIPEDCLAVSPNIHGFVHSSDQMRMVVLAIDCVLRNRIILTNKPQ